MINPAVNYGDKQTTWGSILLLKARELSHYLTDKTKNLILLALNLGLRGLISME